MQKSIIISAELIRGAQACQGVNDIRYYLNGILLAANGDVVGTNGHILFHGHTADSDNYPAADTILAIDGKIPANAKTVRFDFTPDSDRGLAITDKGKAFPFEIIDGKYPDYPRVIPKIPRESAPAPCYRMNALLLGKLPAAFGKDTILEVYTGANREAVVFTAPGPDDTLRTVVVMPCRL